MQLLDSLGDGIVIPAGTTTSQTQLITVAKGKQLVIVTNVSTLAGGTVQVTINGITPSGYIYPLLVGLALSAVGVVPLRIGAALTPSANAVSNDVIPQQLQVVTTVTGTITYGVDFIGGY